VRVGPDAERVGVGVGVAAAAVGERAITWVRRTSTVCNAWVTFMVGVFAGEGPFRPQLARHTAASKSKIAAAGLKDRLVFIFIFNLLSVNRVGLPNEPFGKLNVEH